MPWMSVVRSRRFFTQIEQSDGIHDDQGEQTGMSALPLVLALSLMAGQSGARNASSATPQQASSQRSQNMKIKINIGGKILTARLANNATARDFVSVLPLNLSMKDLFGREKYGDLRSEERRVGKEC